MKREHSRVQARARLDERFAAIGPAARFTPPARGWVRAIRQALGMTGYQLANRMGVKQPSINALERSEAKGSIELATLRRAAAALDCELVYALVPNRSLESKVHERARDFVLRRLEPVEHSMLLEDQEVASMDAEGRIDEIARETAPRLLWD